VVQKQGDGFLHDRWRRLVMNSFGCIYKNFCGWAQVLSKLVDC
jgi:hypothetical protein